MKKYVVAAVALLGLAAGIASYIAEAAAACPPGTRYQCFQTYSGKMNCGCY